MADKNRKIVERFFHLVFEHGEFDYIDEILAPGYTYNGQTSNAERTKQWAKRKRKRYRQLAFYLENWMSFGETVSFDWTMEGYDTEAGDRFVVKRGHSELEFRQGWCVANRQTESDPAAGLAT